jgi:phage-related protein
MDVFDLVAKLSLDQSEYEKGLNDAKSTAENKASAFGGVLGGIGKVAGGMAKATAVAVGTVATGIGALTAGAVKNYSDFEQLAGGAELMFGEAYDFIMEKSKNAYATVQMSQNDYLTQVNGFATGLKTALGGNEQASAELADKIIQAEADIVSATGNTQENVQNAFNGIMKGNYTMLDNLQIGITPTKEGMQEVIDKVNEWNEAQGEASNYTIDNLADCESAVVDYIEMVGMSGYAQNEASKTIQGSLASMQGAWQNLLTGLGDSEADLGQLVDNVVDSASTLVGNVLPIAEKAVEGAGTMIEKIVPKIMDEVPNLINNVLPSLLESASSAVESIISSLSENKDSIVQGAVSIINTLVDSITTLAPELLGVGLEVIVSLANGISSPLPTLIPTIVSVVLQIGQTLIEHLPELIQAGLSIAMGLLQGLIEAIPLIVDSLPTLIDAILTTLIDSADLLLDGALQMFMAIVDAIPDIIDAVVNALPQIIDSIVRFLTGDGLPKILNGAIQMLMGIIQAIPTIVSSLASALPSIISTLVTFFINSVPQILSAGVQLLGGLLKAIPQIVSSLASAIPSIVTAIVTPLRSGLGNLASMALSWGGDMVRGFINGITNKLSALKDKVKGMADTIKSYLHFSEPDVGPLSDFHTYAPDMMDLFMKGITDNEDKLGRTVSDAFDFKDAMTAPEWDTSRITKSSANTNDYNAIKKALGEINITLYNTTEIDGQAIKKDSYKYTVTRMGDETRAVKVAMGGF